MTIRKFGSSGLVIAVYWILASGGFAQDALPPPPPPPPTPATAPDDVRDLLPDQTIERDVKGFETHRYKFYLKTDEFFQVRVERKNVNIFLSLLDEKGKRLASASYLSNVKSPLVLSFVAASPGSFVLRVLGMGAKSGGDGYSLRREASRTATDQDRRRVEIERVFSEAMALRFDEAENALSKFETALKGWQELKEDSLIATTTDLLKDLAARIEREKKLKQANSIFEEGKKLHSQATSGSKQEASAKFERALRLYRELDDQDAIDRILILTGTITGALSEKTEGKFKKTGANLYRIELERGKLFHATAEIRENDTASLVLTNADREPLKSGYKSENGVRGLYFVPEKTGSFLFGIINYDEKPKGSYVLQTNAPFVSDKEKSEAGDALHLMGNRASASKDYEFAVLCHSQALKWRRELPDNFRLGRTLEWLAGDYAGLENHAQALKINQEALEVYRKTADPINEEISMLKAIGTRYLALKQYERAMDIARERLEIVRKLNQRTEENINLNFIGDVYKEMNQPIRAVEYYGQALSVVREAKDRPNEFWTLVRLGQIYLDLSQYTDGLEHFQLALTISREIKDREAEDRALNGIGRAYSGLGRYEDSIKVHEQELLIIRELKNRKIESIVLNDIGSNWHSLGQYDKAIGYYFESLAISRELNDLNDQAVSLNYIGSIFGSLGSHRKAIELFTESLEIYRKQGKRGFEAGALGSLGVAYQRLDQYDKAIGYYEQAIPVFRELKYNEVLAGILNYYGAALRKKDQVKRAFELHQESYDLCRLLKIRSCEGFALSELGWDLLEQNDFEKAISSFERSLTIYREIKELKGELYALRGLTEVWSKRGQKSLAVFYGKQAVNLLQTVRRDVINFEKDVQANFISDNEKVYRKTAEIMIAAGRLAEAEQVTNLLKQEEYSDYTRRDPNDPNGIAKDTTYTPEEEKARVEYLKQAGRITEIGRRAEELKLKRPRTPKEDEELALLQRDLDSAVKDFQDFLQNLVKQFPDTRAGGEQALRVEDSEAFMDTLRVLGEETGQPGRVAAVYTIVGEKQLSLIVVTSQNRVAETVDISETDLNTLVNDFRIALRDTTVDPRQLGARLYKQIFAPIEKHIRPLTRSADGKTEEVITLMWSLDGTLRYVPIAALYDESRNKYMVERFRNTVFTFKSKDKLKDKPSEKWRALGLGVTEKRTENGIHFDPLPKVEEELAIIGDEEKPDQTKPLNGKVLQNRTFSLEAMRSELDRRRPVVHIASHFNFAPTNDDDSFLLLGQGRWTVTQMREMGQVFGGVQLLTLSACNTAMGSRDGTGKEIDGFGIFAQDKGAQAVIATLWAVADQSTSELMQKFYRLRADDASLLKAEAMRRAQLALIYGTYTSDAAVSQRGAKPVDLSKKTGPPPFRKDDSAPFAHPYFWSPFILFGNWR